MQAVAELQDVTIRCECGTEFVFTAEQQRDYERRGFKNQPKRCPSCRNVRKLTRQNTSGPRRLQSTEHLTDKDLLIEVCKAVNELRVFISNEIADLRERLDRIEGSNGG